MTTPAKREAERMERELREKLAARAELVAAALAVADATPCRTTEDRIAWRKALDRLKTAAKRMRET